MSDENTFYVGGINFQKLAEELKANLRTGFSFEFDYLRYTNSSVLPPEVVPFVPTNVENAAKNIPFVYTNSLSKRSEDIFTEGSFLNRFKGKIELEFYGHAEITSQGIIYSLSMLYEGASKFKIDLPETANTTDFRLDDKYRAFSLKTYNVESILKLMEFIRPSVKDSMQELYKRLIIDTYNKHKGTNSDIIRYIYRYAPVIFLSEISDENKKYDIQLLLDYDKGSFKIDGWFKDSSTGLIALLASYNDLGSLFDYFYTNPKLLMDIYDHLDRNNEKVLADIIYLLILFYPQSNSDNTVKGVFFKNSTFYIDSDITDNVHEKIVLRNIEKTQSGKVLQMQGSYHPFDMIKIINSDDYSQSVELPAIYVKYLADAEEWADVEKATRIVIDILAIILTIASLGSATPLTILLASIDTTILVTDIVITAESKELEKTEEGRQFLKNWNRALLIYGAGSVLGPLFTRSALSLGAELIAKYNIVSMRQYVKTLLTKLIIDTKIAKFERSLEQIVVGEESLVGLKIRAAVPNWCSESGALIVKAFSNNSTNTQFAVFYKGEHVFKGSVKEITQLLNVSSKSLFVQKLEELWRFTPKLTEDGKFLTITNKIGTNIKWGYVPIKNMKITINSFKGSTNITKVWEGEVAAAMQEIDDVTQVGTKAEATLVTGKKQTAGDLDTVGERFWVEAKESLSLGYVESGDFADQIMKYINKGEVLFMNTQNKHVLIVVKKFTNGANANHPVFSFLKNIAKENNIKLDIITNLSQLKKFK